MEDLSQANLQARQGDIPCWQALAAHLSTIQSSPLEALGRQYQREILDSGELRVPSPFSGSMVASRSSFVLKDKTVFYYFRDRLPFFLATSNLGRGFPFTAVVMPSLNWTLGLGDAAWGVQRHHLIELEKLATKDSLVVTDDQSIFVVIGDPNFAHMSWNQMVAVENLLLPSKAQRTSITLLVTHEPLGPIEIFFPELEGFRTRRVLHTALPGMNGAGKMFVSLGGFRVTASLQRRVLGGARRLISKDIELLASELSSWYWPIFWITVRTANRTADNQENTIVLLCEEILRSFPVSCILLDGFSTPHDAASNPSYNADLIAENVAEDSRVANTIVESLIRNRRVGPNQRVRALVGCSVPESIFMAQYAHFYFSHQGTVQHKIGWFANKPGIIHSNPRTLTLKPAEWSARQVEEGIQPLAVSPEMVSDLAPDHAARKGRAFAPRGENYTFSKPTEVVSFFMEAAKVALFPA
jgi:hypothetical protein